MVIKLSVLTQSAVQKRAKRLKPIVRELIEELELAEEPEEIVKEKLGVWDSIKSWLIRIKDKLINAD